MKMYKDYEGDLTSSFLISISWVTFSLFALTVFIWALYILLHTGKNSLNHLPFFLMVVILASMTIVQGLKRIIKKYVEDKRACGKLENV